MNIKFQNTKANRKALREIGYEIHDPHATFNRKVFIIIGEDGLLYGVMKRNCKLQTVEEFSGIKL